MVQYQGHLLKPLSDGRILDDSNMVDLAEILASTQRSLRMDADVRRLARAMCDYVNMFDFGDDCEHYFQRLLITGSFANCYYELLRKFGGSTSEAIDAMVKRQIALLEEFYSWDDYPTPPPSPTPNLFLEPEEPERE